MPKRPKYVISIFFLVVLVAGSLISGLFCRSRAGAAAMGADGSSMLSDGSSVKAADLSSSFDSNEVLSDSLYLYKVLSVRGAVQKIVRRESGNYVISLDGRGPGRAVVDCHLDSVYNARYLSLRNGDSVTLRGTCAGRLLNVILMQCIIEK